MAYNLIMRWFPVWPLRCESELAVTPSSISMIPIHILWIFPTPMFSECLILQTLPLPGKRDVREHSVLGAATSLLGHIHHPAYSLQAALSWAQVPAKEREEETTISENEECFCSKFYWRVIWCFLYSVFSQPWTFWTSQGSQSSKIIFNFSNSEQEELTLSLHVPPASQPHPLTLPPILVWFWKLHHGFSYLICLSDTWVKSGLLSLDKLQMEAWVNAACNSQLSSLKSW